MKTAVRGEFKSRFDGSDKPFENVREPAGPDGKYDEEVNKELEWEEFESNLNGLKNGRAGGVDGIRNELLKECGDRTKRLLFLFTRTMMETGHVPEELNVGRVKLIFKSGDPLDPANYRPITVSSVIVKLFTKIYGVRLSRAFENNGILDDTQIGFRPNRGTADAILMINSIIAKYKKKKRPLHMAFVDLTKAYDKVGPCYQPHSHSYYDSEDVFLYIGLIQNAIKTGSKK